MERCDFGRVSTLAFIVIMFLVIKPLLNEFIGYVERSQHSFLSTLSQHLCHDPGAAAVTEWIGIHAIFGAFLLGVIISSDSSIAKNFQAKLKEPVTVLLLPLSLLIQVCEPRSVC